jgi:predicted transcriptional regulator
VLIKELYHPHPKTVLTTATVGEVIKILVHDRVNGLVVVDQHQKVKGVVSLQDIAGATVPTQFRKNVRMAAAMYRVGFFAEICLQLKTKPVTSVMRKEFISVTLDDNIMAVTADFLKNDLYIVPVMDKHNLIGVVTRTEIKKAIAESMGAIAQE